jgi:glycosyltransferase involved in cell wall biosynthesis
MADVAIEMARRGHRVLVYAANRGYENPLDRYAARETLHGVQIRRLPFSSFGKRRIITRVIGTAIFMLQAFFVTLFTPNVDGVFFSTSPPLIGFVTSIAALLRRVPVAYWAMDLNPDQLIAMGKIKPASLPASWLESINRFILRRAALVIALDRFMAERLRPRARLDGKLLVMPPWPHEEHIEQINPATNPFRIRHKLADKFVVMYSGNHSPSNPLTTLLQAASQFKHDPKLRFLFVGGGLGKKEVEAVIEEHHLSNVVISLPYQPLADLRFSLSAADVHVVSLGPDMVGIIHPCKIYGAMAVAKPILFFGPRPSHISDLLDEHRFGWHVAHGDVAATAELLRQMPQLPTAQLSAMGDVAQRVLRATLSQETLCARFCDALEEKLNLRPTPLE